MNQESLDYNEMVESALRSVLRRALLVAATEGMPGEHHFYVTFRTHFPGVRIPPYLRARYPEEMTIVLQHQFWELTVEEEGFSVGLSFNKVQEQLVIPYAAVTAFADPSVQFGLQFNVPSGAAPPAPEPAGDDAPSPQENEKPRPAEGAEVVTLDAFRKK
ncbi:SspB family protein [Oceanibacterium hippocampi]|uniref:Stringent starvation protein B n=1 Tax=Oceanibacterium hippocampi TaxID=745714 RepID=A0A1Y5TRC1_9PROT|nr:ClpXP protease specificity-enhancing factor SspB [Oceanibacterium hippocampi]SLN70238.1 Stringent starvation protein B [Oceanibacterium hippocampi]